MQYPEHIAIRNEKKYSHSKVSYNFLQNPRGSQYSHVFFILF